MHMQGFPGCCTTKLQIVVLDRCWVGGLPPLSWTHLGRWGAISGDYRTGLPGARLALEICRANAAEPDWGGNVDHQRYVRLRW
jgi:hypothetical protein